MAIVVMVATAPANRAAAGNLEEARAYLEKATAEYALYKYAAAAEHFEKAFELKPDSALLFDAAQSHRLAGNKERALALYESYLRVYPKDARRLEIEAHIRQLRLAMTRDQASATSPLSPVAPVAVDSHTVRGAPPPLRPEVSSTQLMLTPSPDRRSNEPMAKKTWLWVAVGGAVATAILVVLLTSTGSHPASASLGRVSGN